MENTVSTAPVVQPLWKDQYSPNGIAPENDRFVAIEEAYRLVRANGGPALIRITHVTEKTDPERPLWAMAEIFFQSFGWKEVAKIRQPNSRDRSLDDVRNELIFRCDVLWYGNSDLRGLNA